MYLLPCLCQYTIATGILQPLVAWLDYLAVQLSERLVKVLKSFSMLESAFNDLGKVLISWQKSGGPSSPFCKGAQLAPEYGL